MRIIDEKLLDKFRVVSNCELCWCWSRVRLDPHHIFCKGIGSGSRLDIKENLIALCRTCHANVHSGNVPRQVILDLVAMREGTTGDKLLNKILELKNAKKGTARESETDSGDRDNGKELLLPDPTEPPPIGGVSSLQDEEDRKF